VSPVQSFTRYGSPPSDYRPVSNLWADLPEVNRKLLLQRLSYLLERLFEPNLTSPQEDGDEHDDSPE